MADGKFEAEIYSRDLTPSRASTTPWLSDVDQNHHALDFTSALGKATLTCDAKVLRQYANHLTAYNQQHPLGPQYLWCPRDRSPAIRVYIADLTSILACKPFAENLLEQLHGAEAEAVRNLDEVLQSRRSFWFPYYGSHSALPLISFRLNTPFHLESLVFHLNCSPPLQLLSILLPHPPPNFPLPSNNVNSASSIPRYRHAKSSLYC
ncbi:hypothetical protein K443DRAFT_10108 [Laccaria amethystina LaAM-08-1]|uniref:Uncharacterized protein n=1 Tax=Laccaria amethystina LaAM-08-1 TaxID=1095629 RepID=A0A0C9WLB6_9AGAR|nr:hypothetical protein K443DRAFT_10108 [Laccaria amethystina LaAM-08-1]